MRLPRTRPPEFHPIEEFTGLLLGWEHAELSYISEFLGILSAFTAKTTIRIPNRLYFWAIFKCVYRENDPPKITTNTLYQGGYGENDHPNFGTAENFGPSTWLETSQIIVYQYFGPF